MSEVSFIRIPETIAIAIEVINGTYGNGEDRKKSLKRAGYDYTKIQHCVNDLMPIFNKYKE
jgi:hypothetical protein